MAKTKLFIGIIILLAILALAYFVFYKDNKNIVSLISQTIGPKNLVVEDKKITDTTKPFNIDITYPYILGAEEFNKKVEEIINGQIEDFKIISLENDTAVKETDPVSYEKFPREYSLNIEYDKGQIDENIISTVLQVYAFTGGAHGSTNFIPVNYNQKTKKEITLSDIFAGQDNYLQKISDYCIPELTKQITESVGSENAQYIDNDWIQRGAGPAEENFSVFLINKDNITFYFQQYQVAAGAYGEFRVVMPK